MNTPRRSRRLRCFLFVLLALSILPLSAADLKAQTNAPSYLYLPLLMKDYTPPLSIFGIQMDYAVSPTAGLQQALAAGAHWLRFDAFDWDRIEPVSTSPATYRWDQVDEPSLVTAADNGLRMIAVVKYTPDWAQKHATAFCGPIHSEALGRYADFLYALVSRYKNPPFNIKHWELGNEPDVPTASGRPAFGCWGDPNDPYFGGEYYALMLQAAYPAIKAADPEARVLLGGLLLDNPDEATDNSARFLEGILKAGGGSYFDWVSFHGYSYPYYWEGQMSNPKWPDSGTTVTQKAALIRTVLNRYGYSNKPLIQTEASLYCDADTPEHLDACLETQAMFVPRAYAEGIAAGLQGLIYYALICEYRSLGLLRTDLSPRPSYRAYQTASSSLSKARYAGPAAGYPEGITGYSFVPFMGGSLDLIWSQNGVPKQVTLPPGSSAFDRYRDQLDAVSGSISVGNGPVYIKRP